MMAVFRYWRHFLALEDDFAKSLRYVEFTPDNFKTYSIEFVKLLLAVGSEVDVVCKDVCQALDPEGGQDSIHEYRDCISVRNVVFNERVLVPKYELKFQPWKAWHAAKGDPPDWWTSYNKVKHHRGDRYLDANLENVANALAGLFVMILYCHKAEESHDPIDPMPQLLHLEEKVAIKPKPRKSSPYILPFHVHAFTEAPIDKATYPLVEDG